MNSPVPPERATQDRVVALFRDKLGYDYLGNWADRVNNRDVEDDLLKAYLARKKYSPAQIGEALRQLHHAAEHRRQSLYERNQAVYSLLRYGAKVQTAAGKHHETVHFIDWANPQDNDFAIAEEVTLCGNRERRPDVAIYVNGIALGLIELKRSSVSIGEGIRQLISNQSPDYNEWFFGTVQFLFAGSDSEGLRYGTAGTPEKHYLTWKEDGGGDLAILLDRRLAQMCRKERFIELVRDFVLFDGGKKKVPRPHQYFGIKAAQEHVRRREGGIVWHAQGSGKSIVMVLLAKWILENNPHARVAIVTDRDELDRQIKDVFEAAGETMHRTRSGRDLMRQLGQKTPRLLCSLIHKFGTRGVENFEQYVREIEEAPSPAVGELFVFVDECHRTESGRLHKVMKKMLRNAVFIGFTGTPLLKADRQTTFEVFGRYIHTYKFNEAVADQVVLDLSYEPRDIDQRLTSPDKVDEWFERKTKGLNDWKKAELKRQWGTMQMVLSSKSRIAQVVKDVVLDFETKPRLASGRGNAMLVSSSIYEACQYYKLFQDTPLKGHCVLVTSYDPESKNLTKEDTGADNETDLKAIHAVYKELLAGLDARPGLSVAATYEKDAKKAFKENPGETRLAIVVSMLLTGFDAPPCTYLYIDKFMQDHGLFQAICRTNRLDGEDKDFGYVVDYKHLFKKMASAMAVYTSELDHSTAGADPEVLLKQRLELGKERLEQARQAFLLLCEPVPAPKDEQRYIRYFCGDPENPDDLKKTEARRTQFYQSAAAYVRAYANLADSLAEAGYSPDEAAGFKDGARNAELLRNAVRNASGESLDLKAYEADMRYLINNYIAADETKPLPQVGDKGLMEMLKQSGLSEQLLRRMSAVGGNRNAAAETIENNIRSKIIQKQLADPEFFEKMSKQLTQIIQKRRAEAIQYEKYLQEIAKLERQVEEGKDPGTPKSLKTSGQRALYNNLDRDESLALRVHEAVHGVKADAWRGNPVKEREIKRVLFRELKDDGVVLRIFNILVQNVEY